MDDGGQAFADRGQQVVRPDILAPGDAVVCLQVTSELVRLWHVLDKLAHEDLLAHVDVAGCVLDRTEASGLACPDGGTDVEWGEQCEEFGIRDGEGEFGPNNCEKGLFLGQVEPHALI